MLRRRQEAERVAALLSGATSLLHRPGKRFRDALQRLLRRARSDVEQFGPVPCTSSDLRDARAHRPRADHQQALHVQLARRHQTFPK